MGSNHKEKSLLVKLDSPWSMKVVDKFSNSLLYSLESTKN